MSTQSIKRLVLCAGLAASAGLGAATTDLNAAAAWQVWGSAAFGSGTAVIGDTVGYDPNDSDHDNNPYERWFAPGQGQDYDEAMSKTALTPPFKLSFDGCFPATQYGYNRIVLGPRNAAFTDAANSYQYPIGQKFGFTTRWDYAGYIHSFVVDGAGADKLVKVPGATAGAQGYCGIYGIDWDGRQIAFSYNGTVVDRRDYAYTEPVYLMIRSFESPHRYTAMTLEQTGTAVRPGSGGVGTLLGQASGSASCDGQAVAVQSATASVSTDLDFVVRDDGSLLANISGSGSVTGAGVSFTYNAAYDAATQVLTGNFRDGDDSADRAIVFTPTGSMAWQASIAGTVNAAGKACTYDLKIDIALPAEAIFASSGHPAGSRFSGPITRAEPISFSVDIPELNFSRSFSTTFYLDGSWTARFTNTSNGAMLSGSFDGAFRIDPPINTTVTVNIPSPYPGITVPPISIPIDVDLTGRIVGNLYGNLGDNSLTFKGSWNSSSVSGIEAAGSIEMPVPFGPGGAPPTSLQPSIVGTARAPVQSPISLPQIPTAVSIPVNVRPSVPFVFQ